MKCDFILLHDAETEEPMLIDKTTIRLIKPWKGRTMLVSKDKSIFCVYVVETVEQVYKKLRTIF